VNSLNDEFHPVTPTESALVESMAVARWRLMRIWAVESAGITHEIRKQSEFDAGENPPTRALLALRILGERGYNFETISRYETRYDRQYHSAFARLLRLRAEKSSTEPR
jgi:hypothetical protein